MAVPYDLTTRWPTRNSYTTSVDSTLVTSEVPDRRLSIRPTPDRFKGAARHFVMACGRS